MKNRFLQNVAGITLCVGVVFSVLPAYAQGLPGAGLLSSFKIPSSLSDVGGMGKQTAEDNFSGDKLRGFSAKKEGTSKPLGMDIVDESKDPDWRGYYAGIHAGATHINADPAEFLKGFAETTSGKIDTGSTTPKSLAPSLVASFTYKNIQVATASFGIFGGMNIDFSDDLIIGIDAEYSHSENDIQRKQSPSYGYAVIDSVRSEMRGENQTKVRLTDWGAVRGRAGYKAGNFLPYFALGVGIGMLENATYSSGTWKTYTTGVDGLSAATFINGGTYRSNKNGRTLAVGASIDIGADYMLSEASLLRFSWGYTQFFSGKTTVGFAINTLRIGGGVRF